MKSGPRTSGQGVGGGVGPLRVTQHWTLMGYTLQFGSGSLAYGTGSIPAPQSSLLMQVPFLPSETVQLGGDVGNATVALASRTK